jgi:hypothetical protein
MQPTAFRFIKPGPFVSCLRKCVQLRSCVSAALWAGSQKQRNNNNTIQYSGIPGHTSVPFEPGLRMGTRMGWPSCGARASAQASSRSQTHHDDRRRAQARVHAADELCTRPLVLPHNRVQRLARPRDVNLHCTVAVSVPNFHRKLSRHAARTVVGRVRRRLGASDHFLQEILENLRGRAMVPSQFAHRGLATHLLAGRPALPACMRTLNNARSSSPPEPAERRVPTTATRADSSTNCVFDAAACSCSHAGEHWHGEDMHDRGATLSLTARLSACSTCEQHRLARAGRNTCTRACAPWGTKCGRSCGTARGTRGPRCIFGRRRDISCEERPGTSYHPPGRQPAAMPARAAHTFGTAASTPDGRRRRAASSR